MRDDPSNQSSLPSLIDEQSRRATELITRAREGDAKAVNELVTIVYPELKRRARWLMARERPGHTFGPSGSELVQRVMEKVLATGGHVFSAADTEEDLINLLTRHMRFLLVDYARAATADRRPGPGRRVQFDDIQRSSPISAVNMEEVLSTDEVLTRLVEHDPAAAEALELRFFAGLTNEEAAGAMGLSVASFRRTLKRATLFLRLVMEPPEPRR